MLYIQCVTMDRVRWPTYGFKFIACGNSLGAVHLDISQWFLTAANQFGTLTLAA